jgi:mannose-6-phosphate isomerase-like protein (cupin superfamily)
MGRIRVSHSTDCEPVVGRDVLPPERHAELSDEELDSIHRDYFPRDGERLSLAESTFLPGTVVRPHAHNRDEIIYVTRGELRAGSHVLGPGDALYIDSHTLYGFTVGPEGCTFVNFRVSRGQYIPKAELLEQRRTAGGAGDAPA